MTICVSLSAFLSAFHSVSSLASLETHTDSSQHSSAFQLRRDVRPEWKAELCKQAISSLLIHNSPSGRKYNVFVQSHCTGCLRHATRFFKVIKPVLLDWPPQFFFRSDDQQSAPSMLRRTFLFLDSCEKEKESRSKGETQQGGTCQISLSGLSKHGCASAVLLFFVVSFSKR